MPRPHIVILTGAGISAESGVPTFRDATGLWEGHRPEQVATPEAFARDPDLVQRFYNERRKSLDTVAPNAAHLALAELQKRFDGTVTLVTQNVDDLHERAGSPDVLHMHGELRKARCTACDHVTAATGDLDPASACPHCTSTGTLRPHVVWFGELPLHMDEIAAHLRAADLFAAIGTSGLVYPAAGFVATAAAHGARCLELNLDATGTSPDFHEHVTGSATTTVPDWVNALLA